MTILYIYVYIYIYMYIYICIHICIYILNMYTYMYIYIKHVLVCLSYIKLFVELRAYAAYSFNISSIIHCHEYYD